MDVPLSLSQPQASRQPGSTMRCMADYSVIKEVGEGSFSTVYYAKEKAGDKREVALKVCMKSLIVKKKMVPYIHREKDTLVLLNRTENVHPSIVTLFATFHDAESLYFVLSYAKYGDLVNLVTKQPDSRLTVHDARYYSAILLSALMHIHSLGIIHRDVKPENLLVKEDGRILLSDFGSSKFLKDYERADGEEEEQQPTGRRRSFVGTAHFVTPELLKGQQMGPASDFWSFSVCLFFFLTGKHPFDDPSEYLIFRRVQDILYTFPENFDKNAKHLIEHVLVTKIEERLTAHELTEHDFFRPIDFTKLQELEPPKIYL
ncbi:unnamed protein product [Caenorhabditis sp. 36 PRJEB53466]|nr:unnamed protein product [Caenorhabditis sp. 36 PRJEB53466]